MNIIQIISTNRPSGATSMVIILGTHLRQRGHDVAIVCPPGGWLPEKLREIDVPVVEMRMKGMRTPQAIFELRSLARSLQADLIHTHLTRATFIGHGAGRLARVPVVSTVHVRQRNIAYRYLPQQDGSVIAVSEYLRRYLIDDGVTPSRVQTIYNGTDFDLDKVMSPDESASVRAELNIPSDACVIGLFGQINDFKGSSLLVEAAKTVTARFPCTYFLFVGPAEPNFQRELMSKAREGGFSDRLRFTGVRSDIQRLMSVTDIITLPSLYETFGMVLIEAMAVRKPVVATRAGGVPELVRDGETGILIERTSQALADALIAMLADPQWRLRMGETAHEDVKVRFTADKMIDKMETLYTEMVAHRLPLPFRSKL